jgi:hypothetical protein
MQSESDIKRAARTAEEAFRRSAASKANHVTIETSDDEVFLGSPLGSWSRPQRSEQSV